MDPHEQGNARPRRTVVHSKIARKTGSRPQQAAGRPVALSGTSARKVGRPNEPPPVRGALGGAQPAPARAPGTASKSVGGRAVRPVAPPAQPRADRAQAGPAIHMSARKQAAPPPPNRGQPQPQFAGLQQYLASRASKTVLLPPWIEDANVSSGIGRNRGVDDVGGRTTRMGGSFGARQRVQMGQPVIEPLNRRDRGDSNGPTRDGWFVGPHLTIQRAGIREEPYNEDHDDERYEVARATKGARKPVNPIGSERALQKTAAGEAHPLMKAAKKSQIYDLPDDVIELSSSSDEGEDIDQLARALDALTLASARLQQFKQLPFLLRNLRKGFRIRCEKANITTAPQSPPTAPVSVVYRYDWDNGAHDASGDESDHIYEEWQGSMVSWSCPLCRLHGNFDTREMLEYHLGRDHNEVRIGWAKVEKREGVTWQIVLTIPDIKEEADLSSSRNLSSDSDDQTDDVPHEDMHLGRRSPSAMLESPIAVPQSPLVAAEKQNLHRPSPSPLIIDEIPGPPERPRSPMLIPKKFRAASPAVSSSASRSASTAAWPQRQHTVSTRGSLPARYPSPPPPTEPHGPAAQYPYIPEGECSCRIGGPKIYDLLNSLSLEPFGVLSWMVVDREEELFELDDVRDEDKVMMALWNRWILLNRPDFIFKGYFKGVLSFIEEYWRMIHRAAGWGALRAFLLMLVAHRFLTPSEVVKLLKNYEEHTGMDHWYKNDPSEEPGDETS